MKKTVIFGITPFSLLLRSEMEEDGRPVAAFTVDQSYMPPQWDDPTPVVALESLQAYFGDEPFEVVVSVGYKRMNENRAAAFAACDRFGYEIGSFIHSSAFCRAESMGRGNIVMANCKLHRFSRIGEGNIFINDTVLGHESVVGDFNFFAGITTGGLVRIGSYSFLGMKSVVCNDISVGDYTLLGAGTVLSKSSEPHTVVMPAKNRSMTMDTEAMASLLV